MINRSTAKRVVREAAAHLRAVEPDWYNKIDTTKLDMSDIHNCILGQVFGIFTLGADAMDIEGQLAFGGNDLSLAFCPSLVEKEHIQPEWLNFINYLRGSQNDKPAVN